MKYILLVATLSSFSFAGGDFFDVELETRFEKMDIEACANDEPATLLPYDGEDIPLAVTEPYVEGC